VAPEPGRCLWALPRDPASLARRRAWPGGGPGGLRWRPALAACAGGLRWRPRSPAGGRTPVDLTGAMAYSFCPGLPLRGGPRYRSEDERCPRCAGDV